MLTWFAFGTVTLGLLLKGMSWQVLLYAILSLSLVRMLPVMVCLAGKGLRLDTRLFIGWFGPRGLASIVFVAVVAWTIVLSVVLHGLSANRLAAAYGARVEATRI